MKPEILAGWLKRLEGRDPKLHAELTDRLAARAQPALEANILERPAAADGLPADAALMLETIVREGRPALLVKGGRISREDTEVDELSREIVERVTAAAPTIEPTLPLVGRIDVANFAGTADYLGTGWLVAPDVVVTNRHVAQLIARWDGGTYRFRAGRFGDPLECSVNYARELGRAGDGIDIAKVEEVIWIEPDALQADIAFLKVARRSDGAVQDRIELAERDGEPGSGVAVIGYPARAPAHVIPDQAWMERIYGGTYDVKRIAPGLMDDESRGWATHDCTTLGGNSGSVVVDLATGRAMALHFAGLYMIENYAVPASTIRRYLRDRPWQGAVSASREQAERPATPAVPTQATAQAQPATAAALGSLTVTIPLTVTVTLGQPASLTTPPTASSAQDLKAGVAAFAAERRGSGVLAVRPGYVVEDGRLTDTPCILVAAHPDRVDAVQAACPSPFAGYPVVVRPASLDDQLAAGPLAEAVTATAYNDADRTGAEFSFAPVEEEMTVVCHVGPERSWEVLRAFLDATQGELVSSIYEWHALHVAKAVERELKRDRVAMRLVIDPVSRTGDRALPPGDFDRNATFARWAKRFPFQRVFVPKGGGGLVATSYHIKVTVRDGRAFWLSSGNWKQSSQPVIAEADRLDPRKTGRAGNREWHAVIENATLAARFRNHILADFAQAERLGGTPEAVEPETLVDVPMATLEAVELEAPAAQVLEPLTVQRRVKVRPLLTPDRQGAVFSEAVLELIGSAKTQLVLQNQYIKIRHDSSGFIDRLVEALIERSKRIEDLRIILRSEGQGFLDDASELKRRGLDVERCVRLLPKTHTKGIVVDGRRVLVGSHNWSWAGVTLNRDASLLFEDEEIARYYLSAFELDWDRARELGGRIASAGEAPRLAVGDRPPPGFVRMSLHDYLEG